MLKQAFQALLRDMTTVAAIEELCIRDYQGRFLINRDEFTADAQYAVEQTIDVFGARRVIDDAHP